MSQFLLLHQPWTSSDLIQGSPPRPYRPRLHYPRSLPRCDSRCHHPQIIRRQNPYSQSKHRLSLLRRSRRHRPIRRVHPGEYRTIFHAQRRRPQPKCCGKFCPGRVGAEPTIEKAIQCKFTTGWVGQCKRQAEFVLDRLPRELCGSTLCGSWLCSVSIVCFPWYRAILPG